jgi:hypothetical protein
LAPKYHVPAVRPGTSCDKVVGLLITTAVAVGTPALELAQYNLKPARLVRAEPSVF